MLESMSDLLTTGEAARVLENSRLRTVVADQALALVILRETAGKTD